MNYYQQQTEYEARLKVLRMQRDLVSYEEAQKQLKEELKIEEEMAKQQESEIRDADPLLSQQQQQP